VGQEGVDHSDHHTVGAAGGAVRDGDQRVAHRA